MHTGLSFLNVIREIINLLARITSLYLHPPVVVEPQLETKQHLC